MVRQWQEMFYDERYSEVYLSPDLPDYVMWAEAMGCVGMRVESPEEVAARHRQGQRDRRPPGRHRLPHRRRARRCTRWSRRALTNDDIVVDPVPGRGRSLSMAAVPAPMPATTPSSVLVENKAGVLARVAEPVRPPGLQHLLAGRRAHRRRAVQPHHDRGRRRVGAARADHQAALQADQRRQDQRARPPRLGRARAACSPPCGPTPTSRSQVIELVQTCSRAASSTSATTS